MLREEVMVIGRKKGTKLELMDLEGIRNRVKEIKKRKKGIYKFHQSKKGR
jgi:hypothetical protein